MYLPVYQWNNERSFTKKTQIRIQHEYVSASVSVELLEKFYKEDSNKDSTWICICQCISGTVREVLQRRLKWGFNRNMYLPADGLIGERSSTRKTQLRIQHEYVYACASVEWWEKFCKEDLRIQHDCLIVIPLHSADASCRGINFHFPLFHWLRGCYLLITNSGCASYHHLLVSIVNECNLGHLIIHANPHFLLNINHSN